MNFWFVVVPVSHILIGFFEFLRIYIFWGIHVVFDLVPSFNHGSIVLFRRPVRDPPQQ